MELCWLVLRGMEASQLPGGESALELGVKLFVVVVAVVVVAVLSVFVLGGGRGASQLWSCVVLFCGEWRRVSFRGAKGGESALELGVKLFVAVVAVCFCFGRAGGQSALELGVKLFVVAVVVVLSVFVLGRAGGQSASGAVKGEGGPVSFGVWCETVRLRRRRRAVCFCFGGGDGGESASGAVKGEGGPVSFRGCEGGRGASQLWSCVVLFCGLFLFWGGRGASQLWV